MTPTTFSDYFGNLSFGSFDSEIQRTAKEARQTIDTAAEYIKTLPITSRSVKLINQHNREALRISQSLAKMAGLATCEKCKKYKHAAVNYCATCDDRF